MKTMALAVRVIGIVSLLALGGCGPHMQEAQTPELEEVETEAADAVAAAEPAMASFAIVEPIADFGVESIYEAAKQVVYDEMHLGRITKKDECGTCSRSTDKADFLTGTIDAISAEGILIHIRINTLGEEASEMAVTAENDSRRPHNLERYCHLIFDRTLRRLAEFDATKPAADTGARAQSAVLSAPVELVAQEFSELLREMGLSASRRSTQNDFTALLSFSSSPDQELLFSAYYLEPQSTEVTIARNGNPTRYDAIVIRTLLERLEQRVRGAATGEKDSQVLSSVVDHSVLEINEKMSALVKELRMDVNEMKMDGFSGFIRFRSGIDSTYHLLSYALTDQGETKISLKKEGPSGESPELMFRTILQKLEEKFAGHTAAESQPTQAAR